MSINRSWDQKATKLQLGLGRDPIANQNQKLVMAPNSQIYGDQPNLVLQYMNYKISGLRQFAQRRDFGGP